MLKIFRNAENMWKKSALVFLAGTTDAAILALMLGFLIWKEETAEIFRSTLVGVIVVQPFLLLICLQDHQRRQLRTQLIRMSTLDSVTSCYNGAVFSAAVDRRVISLPNGPRQGALLLIELDQLKAIRLNYGFDWANESLKLIADTIRSSVRVGDIVGQLGAGEFAVFLPSAKEYEAIHIGSRILDEVSKVIFSPGGETVSLAVKVAGVVFESELYFQDLMRAAETELQFVKGYGEIRVATIQ